MRRSRSLLAITLASLIGGVGTGLLVSPASAASPIDCLSLSEWSQITPVYGGPGTTYDQIVGFAGAPVEQAGVTYNSDGTQEFDANFAQCDPNGVRSPDSSVFFVFDTDYGYNSATGATQIGPFKARYKGSWEPVDVVITPAMAAKDPAYCSAEEFRSLKKRMTLARVARILDGRGRRTDRYPGFETRRYGKVSTSSGTVQYCEVTFRDGRLLRKDRTAY